MNALEAVNVRANGGKLAVQVRDPLAVFYVANRLFLRTHCKRRTVL